jgi:hypothetical protein
MSAILTTIAEIIVIAICGIVGTGFALTMLAALIYVVAKLYQFLKGLLDG